MFDFSILVDYWNLFIEGFKNTIIASLIALVGSFFLGAIIAVFRIAPIKLFNWIGTTYVEFIRNIPLMLIIFFFFFGLKLGGFVAGTLGLTIYTSSFIAEAIRAGILAVPKGQYEAARSSGLTYIQTMQLIIVPQAIKIVIPPLGNQFINLVKNSSMLGVVSGFDMMYYADLISSETFKVFSVYIIVALFYLVITIPLSTAVNMIERRLLQTQ